MKTGAESGNSLASACRASIGWRGCGALVFHARISVLEVGFVGFGILGLIDLACIVHAAKIGRFSPWAYVIMFLPGAGALAYFVVEILPECRYAPQARVAQAAIGSQVDPNKRYRMLRGELEIVDTLGNRLALAQECLRLKRFDEALLLYEEILKSPTGDEPVYMLVKAQAEFGLGQPQIVLDSLDELKRRWPAYHSQDGYLLYAKALEAGDRPEEALGEYTQLARYFAGQEVQVRRLLLLDRMGQPHEAEAIADDIMRYYKRAPRHALPAS